MLSKLALVGTALRLAFCCGSPSSSAKPHVPTHPRSVEEAMYYAGSHAKNAKSTAGKRAQKSLLQI